MAQFEIATARRMALACQLAYDIDTGAIAQALGVANVLVKTVGDQACYAAIKDGCPTLLVFRGSATIGTWVDDVDIRPVATLIGKLHEGFWNAYRPLSIFVSQFATGPVQLTGHSLGGSLATIASAMIPSKNVLPVYTFGCPRTFAETYALEGREHIRVVNDLDPVPHVPTFGFQHVGTEWRLPEGGAPSPFRCVTNFLQHARRGLARTIIDAISDHGIDSYVSALAK